VLAAIAADLGKRLEYVSPGVETAVMTMTIEGDLTGLSPDDALAVVAGAAGIAIEESTDRLIIAFER
jgi:hypothetical protein